MRHVLLALALALGVSGIAAAQTQDAVPAPGVYKHRFQNALMSGETYTSEDILELAPYRTKVDYIRLHLEFANGHLCNIWGIARATPMGLLYQGPPDFKGQPCKLTIQRRADGVHVFEDKNGACRAETCGNRGGYMNDPDKPNFILSERRDIHYMPLLLASSEYKAAVAEYETRPPAP